MGTIVAFRCSRCGRSLAPEDVIYTCPDCGPLGILEAEYDHAEARRWLEAVSWPRPGALRRYWGLLPIQPDEPQSLAVGGTPLLEVLRLRQHLGMRALFVKDETRNPSASLKDRATALVLTQARRRAYSTVACASTGNAAVSLATLCAAEALRAVVFVPESAPPGKTMTMRVMGAQVFAVRGSYDAAFDLCMHACARYGWYDRNTAYNPFTLEGKKSAAFEVWEDLGRSAPDVMVIPVGDGCILSGVAKGFRELQALGALSTQPRLVGVVAERAPALARAFRGGTPIEPVPSTTIAGGISVDRPRNGEMAIRDVRATGGTIISVSDQEMIEAASVLARTSGLFVEVASAATLAGLLRARDEGLVGRDERIVLLSTGSGYKDAPAVETAGMVRIDPSLEDLGAALQPRGTSM